MRELTSDTIIHVLTYPDFEETILTEDALIEDAKKYEIGQISEKTGLQKCLVNGRIIWLLPMQNSGFVNRRLSTDEMNTLLKSCKRAKPTEEVKKLQSSKEALKNYTNLVIDWKERPVKSPILNGIRIRLDNESYTHLVKKNGKPRNENDIIRRCSLLPYMRDILERTGKPAEHTIKDGNERFSIVGKANINGTDKGIKILIKRKTDGKYYYFSIMDIEIV